MPAMPTTPKGRRTREHILGAARRVFARDGYVNARVIDVAREAKLSLGAVYRYFENKEDLFAALISNIHDELFAASRAEHADFSQEPFTALLEANQGYLAHYYEHRDVMRVLVEASAVERRFRDMWWTMRRRHVERFVHQLEAVYGINSADGVDALVVASAAACLVEQAAYVWFAHADMADEQVSVDTAAVIVTRAWYRLFFTHDRHGELGPEEIVAFLG